MKPVSEFSFDEIDFSFILACSPSVAFTDIDQLISVCRGEKVVYLL